MPTRRWPRRQRPRNLKLGARRGLVWDGDAARHAIDFFGHLRHSTGEWAGEPFVLQDWQQFVVGSLYGWKRKNGLRRFRTAYVEVARKNGKSVLLAGTALYALIADGEPGAHVYSAATTRDQARIVFGEAERMVAASSALQSRITRTVNNLAVLPTSSWFCSLPSARLRPRPCRCRWPRPRPICVLIMMTRTN